jgi:hypothetical protein
LAVKTTRRRHAGPTTRRPGCPTNFTKWNEKNVEAKPKMSTVKHSQLRNRPVGLLLSGHFPSYSLHLMTKGLSLAADFGIFRVDLMHVLR